MTRVGFVLAGRTVGWLAGWNYYRNLLQAIAATPDRTVEPVVFVGEGTEPAVVDELPRVELHRSSMLDRRTPAGLARSAWRWGLASDGLLGRLLERHGIAVMSHSGHLGRYRRVATLGWVPDLQHRHFPELFDRRTWAFRDARYRLLARFATHLIVSSEFGARDLVELSHRAAAKTTVLRFVIEPVPEARRPGLEELRTRHGVPERYLYLPNQFWMHKNHRLVIDALRLLRQRGREVHVVATGVPNDRRRPQHFPELMTRAREAGVLDRFQVLGLVPYEHVAGLLQEAVALINPSRFEGWSTTVEEARSMGKRVLLSDIPVHREQAPPGGVYFDPADAEQLAEAMWDAWTRDDPHADRALAERARAELPGRRRQFVDTYQSAVARAMEAAGSGA